MKKKILSLIIISTLCFGIIGCNNNKNNDENKTTTNNSQINTDKETGNSSNQTEIEDNTENINSDKKESYINYLDQFNPTYETKNVDLSNYYIEDQKVKLVKDLRDIHKDGFTYEYFNNEFDNITDFIESNIYSRDSSFTIHYGQNPGEYIEIEYYGEKEGGGSYDKYKASYLLDKYGWRIYLHAGESTSLKKRLGFPIDDTKNGMEQVLQLVDIIGEPSAITVTKSFYGEYIDIDWCFEKTTLRFGFMDNKINNITYCSSEHWNLNDIIEFGLQEDTNLQSYELIKYNKGE